jgi:hypothetical protein
MEERVIDSCCAGQFFRHYPTKTIRITLSVSIINKKIVPLKAGQFFMLYLKSNSNYQNPFFSRAFCIGLPACV